MLVCPLDPHTSSSGLELLKETLFGEQDLEL